MKLSEVWRLLEEDAQNIGVTGRVQRRILPHGRRNFLLGIEMPSRNRILIFRVSMSSLEHVPDVLDSRGVNVRWTNREDDGVQAEVVLALTDPEQRDIFDLLVSDLVAAAEQPLDEKDGVNRLLARLSDWQQLLRRLGPRGLSREAQQGLWGELWVVREVVAPKTGVFEALVSWRGPLGADQDFHLGTTRIEVKTSTAATLDRVWISSERQLEVPGGVALLLLGLSLDAGVGSGQTLPDLIGSVRAAAAESGCLRLIDERLDLSGYAAEDNYMYADVGYSVREMQAFRVEEGFPRIVSGDLQPGIGDVSYMVSTSSCGAFRIAQGQSENLLEGLV